MTTNLRGGSRLSQRQRWPSKSSQRRPGRGRACPWPGLIHLQPTVRRAWWGPRGGGVAAISQSIRDIPNGFICARPHALRGRKAGVPSRLCTHYSELLTGFSLRSDSAIGPRRAGATVGRLPLPILHRSLCHTRSLETVFPLETGVLPPGSARPAGRGGLGCRCGTFAQHVREGGTGGCPRPGQRPRRRSYGRPAGCAGFREGAEEFRCGHERRRRQLMAGRDRREASRMSIEAPRCSYGLADDPEPDLPGRVQPSW